MAGAFALGYLTIMHHKRRRPKNRRAGCLTCKPNKANGAKPREAGPGQGRNMADRRAEVTRREQVAEGPCEG